MSFLYVATPYTHYPHGHAAAYRLACVETARLLRHGIPALSPIAHGHGVAEHGNLDPADHGLWMAIDEAYMQAASGLVYLLAKGHEESRGMQAERLHFLERGLTIHYMVPGMVPPDLLAEYRRC
jgi:hypothetical protein